MSERSLLEVDGLDAFYGSAHVLQDVSLHGRPGVGRRRSVATAWGSRPCAPRSWASRLLALLAPCVSRRTELVGKPSYKIARTGIGYVPQGRRLFPSLTVDEHLKIAARNGSGGWTIERVYELFPRLAERKRNGGAELSGGEQQMLAIGRALLGNPQLLIMDEPSEGLAPAVDRHPDRDVQEARGRTASRSSSSSRSSMSRPRSRTGSWSWSEARSRSRRRLPSSSAIRRCSGGSSASSRSRG